MPDIYATISRAKAAGAANRNTAAAADAVWLKHLEAASAEVNERTGRDFAARLVTAYVDVPRACRENLLGARLFLPFDVASITTLKPYSSSPLTYGTALAANTDYLAHREREDPNSPMDYLDRLSTVWTPGERQLELVGYRGYSYEVETTGLTVQDNPMTNSTTTLTVTDAPDVGVGETLKIEDEQVRVTDQPTTTVLTVERAVNGTTAAQHAQGTVIYRRRYPRAIEEATALRAIDLYRGAPGGFGGAAGGEEAGYSSPTSYAQFVGLLKPFRRWVV